MKLRILTVAAAGVMALGLAACQQKTEEAPAPAADTATTAPATDAMTTTAPPADATTTAPTDATTTTESTTTTTTTPPADAAMAPEKK